MGKEPGYIADSIEFQIRMGFFFVALARWCLAIGF